MRLIKYLGFITFQINVCMFTINLTVTEANDTAFLNTSLRILIYAQDYPYILLISINILCVTPVFNATVSMW